MSAAQNSANMYLTKKQKSILDFIKGYLSENEIAPTYEEIADYFGYRSKGTVHKHITNLEKKGLIKKHWNRSRCLQVLDPDPDRDPSELPLLGRVAAGEPIEAIENREEISVPPDMIGNGDHYVLQVAGESMIDENIQDGDYVIVKPRAEAHNGEMVVALINNQDATLKKFYKDGDRIRLEPANTKMSPIILSADRVRIRGKVIGVIRKY
ncbi:MAG TPA: transcriptional repressor LexA [bacterium]|nr:transcriptional repressor LexA [bacterium]